jgi:hypothetical protein
MRNCVKFGVTERRGTVADLNITINQKIREKNKSDFTFGLH